VGHDSLMAEAYHLQSLVVQKDTAKLAAENAQLRGVGKHCSIPPFVACGDDIY
jgi:hypothetical protein